MTINIFAPSVGKCLNFPLKNRLKLRFSHKTSFCGKTVSLTCWAGLMSVGTIFSSSYYECGLQVNQNWLWIILSPVWESGLIFLWKTAKNYVFHKRHLLAKKTVSLTRWAGLMSVSTLFWSL